MAKPPAAEDITALRERFSEAITSVREALGEVTCYVDAALVPEVCRFLRDDPRFDFNMLADLTAVDLQRDFERVIFCRCSVIQLLELRVHLLAPD